ncbi:MAG: Endolytic murein transglycosylase [Candidatus Kaiserbacteria bacterium]|nr:Endolytic murein transglycosylase [Candidatus Kaiserbacteria bacterium]
MRQFLKKLKLYFIEIQYSEEQLAESWKLHANRTSLIIILASGVIALSLYIFAVQPPATFPVDKLVSVPKGQTLEQVSVTLYDDGVIRSPFLFRVLVKVLGHERGVQAGDYIFKQPMDIFTIAHSISLGAFGLEAQHIRIPEGATTKEMSIIFASKLERFNQANFLAQAQPIEGYLFPDTYFFLPNATEDMVIQAMRQNFDTHEADIDATIQASGRSLHDIVIMASIIEREARNTQDRRMISGVLWNRMDKGMALQVDVTFLYTIGKGTFQLTMKDLLSDSPYNTYMNKGLPPTPIGSPSLDSLLAAADPIKSDYYFYLADNKGVTHFSKTYKEHAAKQRLYLGT